MTPKTPESFRNEWNYRDFWRKGQWLKFFKTSALDQLEASILGSWPIGSLDFSPSKFDSGPRISFIPLISASFRQFGSHFWEAVLFCSNFFHFFILPFEPYSNDSKIQAIGESFLRSRLILQYYFFHFLIFSFLPHSTDSRMILPSFLSFVCHYWLSKLIHHQILGAWALGSFCQKAWTRSLSSLDWLLAYWMRLNECRLRLNEIEWV